jgi:hypothetical protein
MSLVVGFFHRLAYAIAVALVGFLLAVMPAGGKIDGGVTAKVLDLPVALAGLVVPVTWKGVDLWFEPWSLGYLTFPEALLRHLRIATPVYVLIFYLPTLGRVVWARLGRRREPVEVPAS